MSFLWLTLFIEYAFVDAEKNSLREGNIAYIILKFSYPSSVCYSFSTIHKGVPDNDCKNLIKILFYVHTHGGHFLDCKKNKSLFSKLSFKAKYISAIKAVETKRKYL